MCRVSCLVRRSRRIRIAPARYKGSTTEPRALPSCNLSARGLGIVWVSLYRCLRGPLTSEWVAGELCFAVDPADRWRPDRYGHSRRGRCGTQTTPVPVAERCLGVRIWRSGRAAQPDTRWVSLGNEINQQGQHRHGAKQKIHTQARQTLHHQTTQCGSSRSPQGVGKHQ